MLAGSQCRSSCQCENPFACNGSQHFPEHCFTAAGADCNRISIEEKAIGVGCQVFCNHAGSPVGLSGLNGY